MDTWGKIADWEEWGTILKYKFQWRRSGEQYKYLGKRSDVGGVEEIDTQR